MPHLRPLGDLLDPRIGTTERRRARRRLAAVVRRTIGAPPAAESRVPWFERAGRNVVDFPDPWRAVDASASPASWAIVLHHTGEDLSATLEELGGVGTAFDLYLLTNSVLTVATVQVPRAANLHVLQSPAGGKDWAFAALVNSGLLDDYPLILRRTTALDVTAVRPSLDPASVSAALSAFACDPQLGVITGLPGPRSIRPRRARPGVRRLLRRLELNPPGRPWTFVHGRDYWVRGFLVQGLRSVNLSRHDFERSTPLSRRIDRLTFEQTFGALAAEAGCTMIGPDEVALLTTGEALPSPPPCRARVVPFYLPQFHPIKENDEWWGPGFTEWTNVTAARPVYGGHFQPKLPMDLGFYDLRLDETRRAQADLAAAHGVAGFMYYYYWFSGRRLLERPIDAMLNSRVDAPFCIMWANENWTRTWDGGDAHVLMGQEYDKVPAADFIDDVLPFLGDDRYLRVSGRAVIAVYRPGQIAGFPTVVDEWRRRAAAQGIPLFVLSVDVGAGFDGLSGPLSDLGVDGTMGFPPHNHHHAPASLRGVRPRRPFTGNLYDYGAMVRVSEERLYATDDRHAFPTVMVNFDNTARRQQDANVWVGANPYTFRRWLNTAVEAVQERPEDERIVFVNAWNEWAEGAILEPTSRFGRTYLQAVRDVVGPGARQTS